MRRTIKHRNKRHNTRKRYTRKSKKYGGAETVFVCNDKRRENKECIEDFEDDQGFIWQDVIPDGNCFFHALELYYKLTYPNNNDNKSYIELRKIIVDFINTHFDEYEPYGITKKDIKLLYTNGGWNNIAGDFVIPAAAPSLNLKIKLYDLKKGNKERKEKKRIILHTYPEVEDGSEREEVNLIRINDNHFGLLIPAAKADSVPITNKSLNKNLNNNNIRKLKERLERYNNSYNNSYINKQFINQFEKLKMNLANHINEFSGNYYD